MPSVDLKRLGDLSDADLWDKLGTNEVPWFNGANEFHKRLVERRDHLAEVIEERNALQQEVVRLKGITLSAVEAAKRLDQGRNEALAANRALQGRVDAALIQRDEARHELAQALEIGKDCEGRLGYRRAEAESLRQQLAEAEQDNQRLRDAAQANTQILQGEQHLLKRALDYLEKVQGVMNDADQDFNFSGNYDPDV